MSKPPVSEFPGVFRRVAVREFSFIHTFLKAEVSLPQDLCEIKKV